MGMLEKHRLPLKMLDHILTVYIPGFGGLINNNNNNFVYIALISWAHGVLQCKKGENEIIYIILSQAWNKKKI